MTIKSQYAVFIISIRMKKEVRKASTQQSDVFASGDYEQGLKVLARLIARTHTKKVANKRIKEDSHLHNGKQVIIVSKRPINMKSDGELIDEETDEI
jgi:hypothetical protein